MAMADRTVDGKNEHMIVSAFSSALLLAGTPLDPGGMQSGAPVPTVAPGAADPAVPELATPAPADAQPPLSAESAAPSSSTETAAPAPPTAADQSEIVVTAKPRAAAGDPLEDVNAKSFEVVQAADAALVRPVALAYQRNVPNPVRSGVRNFLGNLREPVVFINYMLQLKPGKAMETVGRFAINSTIGAAGLFDVAKKRPFNLPRRANGFANTLGYYGVGPGPFFYLPLVGPTTLRDALGDGLDRLIVPLAAGKPFTDPVYVIPLYVVSSLDQRAELDEKLQELHGGTNPYLATREDYLRTRQAEIDELRGKRRDTADPAALPTKPQAD